MLIELINKTGQLEPLPSYQEAQDVPGSQVGKSLDTDKKDKAKKRE